MTTLLNRQTRARAFAACAALLLSGCFGGGARNTSAPDSRYSHALHGRFYRAWQQPANLNAPRGKISVPVDVEIESSGRVARFRIQRPSGYPEVDASIMAVSKVVREVDPPPVGPPNRRFKLRVYFDLDVKR
jgi:TonB family protein